MSDSDSPLSTAVSASAPDDAQVERALRQAVEDTFKREDFDNLTLKRIRAATINKLELAEDFFKTDTRWKDKSKEIVNEEVARLENMPSSPPKLETTTTIPASATAKPSAKRKASSGPSESKRPKSADGTSAPQKKRRKKTSSPSASDELSDVPSDIKDGSANHGESGADEDASQIKKGTSKSKSASIPTPRGEDELGPDSELSDVVDEPPAKVKGKVRVTTKPKSKSDKAKAREKQPSKAKPKANTELTPQEEEIKRLQGHLVKCGVRKLWGKELMRFSTPGEKIAHLKSMLRDVGMEGRFSEEKARQIKEARELRADLEDIRQGEEKWGTKEDDQPRRRLAKGLQELQGLGDDEESD